MQQYIISYIGGDQPKTPEQGKAHFEEYQKWLATLGDAVVKAMVPYKNCHTVSPAGEIKEGSSIAMTGHTIIQASSIEEAIEYVKTCPFLAINGTLEVAELVNL